VRTSVRRSEPPEDATPSRGSREAIAVEELGPAARSSTALPPGARPQLVRRSKSIPPSLSRHDAYVFGLIDGTRTVKQIVDASKLHASETASSLVKLARYGIIVI
jgi:hypothetical protein